MAKDHLYRKGVGIIIINNEGKIFIGKRYDSRLDSWQMPQGGIDENEEEDLAMARELKEETGIEDYQIITKSKNYFYYDLPPEMQKNFWGGKYLGQKHRWYLIKFNEKTGTININQENPEFSEWKWASKDEVIELIIDFKKELYQKVFKEFSDYV